MALKYVSFKSMYLLIWLLIQKKMYKRMYANNVVRQRRAFIMIPVCTSCYYIIPVFQCREKKKKSWQTRNTLMSQNQHTVS